MKKCDRAKCEEITKVIEEYKLAGLHERTIVEKLQRDHDCPPHFLVKVIQHQVTRKYKWRDQAIALCEALKVPTKEYHSEAMKKFITFFVSESR